MAKVWTVGYEGHTPASLLELLQAAEIQHVVDLRRLPLTRKKGFSKNGMRDWLSEGGIGYTHKPELGVEPEVRQTYRITGDFERVRAWYLRHLRTQAPSLAGLLEMADRERVALLCFEAEPEACHRSVLADRLADTGIDVQHL